MQGLGCMLAAVALAGCGQPADEKRAEAERTAAAPPPTGTTSAPEVEAGRRLVASSGCLACHQIAGEGASGPGNNLDGIGTRRSATQLRRALVDARPPMPSFHALPKRDLDAIVAYLGALRDASCPEDSDCG